MPKVTVPKKKNSLRGFDAGAPPQTPLQHLPEAGFARLVPAAMVAWWAEMLARGPKIRRGSARQVGIHTRAPPHHLSTPHLPPPLPTPPHPRRPCNNARGSPRRTADSGLARALSALGLPPDDRGPMAPLCAPPLRCRSPAKPPPFHAQLIALAGGVRCIRQRQPRRAQRGWRAAGARWAAHQRVRAPSPRDGSFLGVLARATRWRQLQAGGSSPTCSPSADLTRARCSRRAGPVGGPSKRPWAGHASTDPATDRLCRWCLSAASRSSAFCLRPAVSCRFAPLQRRFSGLPMVWIDQGWPK